MSDVKWIKISTGLPDSKKLKQIRRLPDGDTIALMWIFLMCLAGDVNDDGYIYFTKEIPYTDEMLAEEFKMDVTTIRLGLKTFEEFEMIELVDNFIYLSAWEKWQSTDKLAELREYNRVKQQESRERRKKKLALTVNDDVNDKSMTSQPCQDTDIDIEEEKEREIDNYISSKEDICQTPSDKVDVSAVISEWNTLSEFGIPSVNRITSGSIRYKNLVARIKQYGMDDVITAINNVRTSKFLKEATFFSFDWFVKPNNFPKVLEGNYNRESNAPNPRNQQTAVVDNNPFGWMENIDYGE